MDKLLLVLNRVFVFWVVLIVLLISKLFSVLILLFLFKFNIEFVVVDNVDSVLL